MIITVVGYATAGKDTVADILCRIGGFRKVSWADQLRRDIKILNPIVGTEEMMQQGHTPITVFVRYNDAEAAYGYTRAKELFPELRRLLQDYGTDVHRTINDDYWIERTLGAIAAGDDVVIPDTRFPNEAKACDVVWGVRRPGIGPVNDHPSDAGLAFPFVSRWFDNDGDIEQLEATVLKAWYNLMTD